MLNMQCKACHTPIAANAIACPSCGVTKPKSMSSRSKKWLLTATVVAVIIIVIIPMVASLLWMQSN